MFDWNLLINDHRIANTEGALRPSENLPDRTPFQADYDRVIYSEPFRRLARKAQVHPLVPNDHVRNRLTHSLEVASVGRSFATRLWKFLGEKDLKPANTTEDDFRQIIQSACLAHDIGNPPFGHAGEYAIRNWANENPESVFGDDKKLGVSERTRTDWEVFEGNAQGFRLASRPDNSRAGYMNLTLTTMATMVKYPWGSYDEKAKSKGKHNFFSSEATIFDRVFDTLGLKNGESYHRHPMSFLSEAADDIGYRIADLEDSVGMKIISEDRVTDLFKSICECDDKWQPLGKLRANAIGCFVDMFWQVFEQDFEAIVTGKRENDLKKDVCEKAKSAINEIDNCYAEIFSHRFKVATELGAYNCLGKITSTMCDAARKLSQFEIDPGLSPEDSDKFYEKEFDFLAKRCFELTFGGQYAKRNHTAGYDWWLHQILDFVSGLTDNYAQQLAREIDGIG
ncbi:MAG: dNTP triphosphohydrolase [Pirellulaceae bacterium]